MSVDTSSRGNSLYSLLAVVIAVYDEVKKYSLIIPVPNLSLLFLYMLIIFFFFSWLSFPVDFFFFVLFGAVMPTPGSLFAGSESFWQFFFFLAIFLSLFSFFFYMCVSGCIFSAYWVRGEEKKKNRDKEKCHSSFCKWLMVFLLLLHLSFFSFFFHSIFSLEYTLSL